MSVRRSLAGLLLAVVALVSQIALGAVVLPVAETPAEALARATVQCEPGTRPAAPEHRRTPLPAVCPLSVSLALPAALPAPDPVLAPVPALLATCIAQRPSQPRAPPFRAVLAARPRGPPGLS